MVQLALSRRGVCRAAVVAAGGAGCLALLGVTGTAWSGAGAGTEAPPPGAAICRWQEQAVRANADASVLSTKPFDNYGDGDLITVGLGEEGTWRSLVHFAQMTLEPSDVLLDATLRLYLRATTGDRRNAVQVCRSSMDWSEAGVTWRTLPPANRPCTETQVGTELTAYEWDATEYVRGVREERWDDTGFVLRSINEFQFNQRDFHGRQSRDGRSHPQLVLRLVHVPRGITATVTAGARPGGGELTVRLSDSSFESGVYDVEWFSQEQTPPWSAVAAIDSPADWGVEAIDARCEQDGARLDSDGVRAYALGKPLQPQQAVEFRLRFEADGIPDRLTLHLSDDQGGYLGTLVALVQLAGTPTATVTATPTATPTFTTPTPSATLTSRPTGTPTPSPTEAPSATPQPMPTAAPQRLYLPRLEGYRRR